jgi:hypothetical protein
MCLGVAGNDEPLLTKLCKWWQTLLATSLLNEYAILCPHHHFMNKPSFVTNFQVLAPVKSLPQSSTDF